MPQMARKIVSGENYSPAFLLAFADATQARLRPDICEPATRRTLAVIRLRLAEEAVSSGAAAAIEQSQWNLDSALLSAFACAPSDPLLWLARFWLQNNMRGLREDNFTALRLSYQFGANEGWLALRRSRFALAIYPALPEDLKRRALEEFVQLVKSDFMTDAADIVVKQGRPISAMLLSHLKGIDIMKLRFLARLLDGRDFEGRVPDVETSSRSKPW